MSDPLSDLPRFGVIAAALRRTTEHLGHELANPGTSTPDWNSFEWEVARAVSSMQGITVLPVSYTHLTLPTILRV